jgi:CRISP-associated protein Cas1
MMLSGRLGLDKIRMPHNSRHGLVWLDRGALRVEAGCLQFRTPGGALPAGDYHIPHQSVSLILLGPGSSVTHDAFRLLASHNTALAAVGEGGVRLYTAPPLNSASSALARRQAERWANPKSRIAVARRMYAIRLGEVLPHRDIEVLRGIEGARVKASYRRRADDYEIEWHGRHYDRANPTAADLPNQAINHASSAVQAAAGIACSAVAAIASLGFIHEDSSQAFVLDIADLFREEITLSIAFGAVKAMDGTVTIDRLVRGRANVIFARENVIDKMIDRIKQLVVDDET